VHLHSHVGGRFSSPPDDEISTRTSPGPSRPYLVAPRAPARAYNHLARIAIGPSLRAFSSSCIRGVLCRVRGADPVFLDPATAAALDDDELRQWAGLHDLGRHPQQGSAPPTDPSKALMRSFESACASPPTPIPLLRGTELGSPSGSPLAQHAETAATGSNIHGDHPEMTRTSAADDVSGGRHSTPCSPQAKRRRQPAVPYSPAADALLELATSPERAFATLTSSSAAKLANSTSTNGGTRSGMARGLPASTGGCTLSKPSPNSGALGSLSAHALGSARKRSLDGAPGTSGGFFVKNSPIGSASLRPTEGVSPMSKVLLLSRLGSPLGASPTGTPTKPSPLPSGQSTEPVDLNVGDGEAPPQGSPESVPVTAGSEPGPLPADPSFGPTTAAAPADVDPPPAVPPATVAVASVAEVTETETVGNNATPMSKGSSGPLCDDEGHPAPASPRMAPPPTIRQQLQAINLKINDHQRLQAAAVRKQHLRTLGDSTPGDHTPSVRLDQNGSPNPILTVNGKSTAGAKGRRTPGSAAPRSRSRGGGGSASKAGGSRKARGLEPALVETAGLAEPVDHVGCMGYEEANQLYGASHQLDEAGLSALFGCEDFPECEDPLGLLYLEPGAIDPSLHATGSPSKNQREGLGAQPDLDMELDAEQLREAAVSQLRELSVLCGEDADSILAAM
jgi:hypothetical protein